MNLKLLVLIPQLIVRSILQYFVSISTISKYRFLIRDKKMINKLKTYATFIPMYFGYPFLNLYSVKITNMHREKLALITILMIVNDRYIDDESSHNKEDFVNGVFKDIDKYKPINASE